MIKIVKGDILQAKENLICHQVNCQGVMNSGIAKSIRQKFPKVYKSYKNTVNKYIEENNINNLLGRVVGVDIGDNKWVVNMFGQFTYGYDNRQYTRTEALFECFKEVRKIAEKNNLSVAIPHGVGCGLGGADWEQVENLLLIAFDGYEVTLYKLD